MAEQNIKTESSYKEVFKNRNFVKLLSGQFFSNFGDAIFRISIVLYVYSITGSAARMTIVLAAQTLPWILIGPISGVFADRFSRKAIMVSSDILRAVSIVAIPFIGSIYPLLVIAFLDGVGSASFAAPRSAAIPEIVGLDLYVKAISISQLIFQIFSVLGPLVAAPLYAFFGAPTFWVTSGCYVVSAIILAVTLIPSASKEKEALSVKTVFGDIKEGISYMFKHPIIRILLILFTFVVVGASFASPLLYPWIFEVRHGGISSLEQLAQTEFGIIGAIVAFGTITGNLLFGRFEKKIGRSRAIIAGVTSLIVYYIIFQFNPSIYLIGAFALVMGTLNGMGNLSINAFFAEEVPNEIRGRAYSATNAYTTVFSVVCLSLSGFTSEHIGIANTMLMASAIIFVGILVLSIKTKMLDFSKFPSNVQHSIGD